MEQKNLVVILLGANLGEKEKMFSQVAEYIQQNVGECVKKSSLYVSKAWGFESSQEFLNQVLMVETEFTAIETLFRCQAIEHKCGRVRHENAGYEDRPIDIDLLYFNNDIVDLENLTIPHPLLHKRRFTLLPLCEILPDYVHPIFMKTNTTLLQECEDTSIVSRL